MELSRTEASTVPGLRLARSRKGLSQRDLAELLGVSPGTIGRYESGLRSPDIHTLHFLASALGCTVAELLGGRGPPFQSPHNGAGVSDSRASDINTGRSLVSIPS